MSPEKPTKSEYIIEHVGDSSIIIPTNHLPVLTNLIKHQIETDNFLEGWQANDKYRRHFIGTLPSGQEIFAKRKRKSPNIDFDILLREFSIQPKLQEIINDPDTQNIVKEFGFTSIRLNPSILGVIIPHLGKFVFTQYQKGDLFSDYRTFRSHEIMIKTLSAVFYQNNIAPYDLSSNNIIIDPSRKHLIIIDTELFTPFKRR